MKFERGTAGLNVLLSVVTLLFVIGLIVMVFALMGGELYNSAPAGETPVVVTAVDENNILHLWNLDDTNATGTLVDSVSTNDLTPVLPFPLQVTATTGIIDGAIQVNDGWNDNHYYNSAYTPNYVNNLTLSFWLKAPTSTEGTSRSFVKIVDGVSRWVALHTSSTNSSVLSATVRNAYGNNFTEIVYPTDGNFHHYTIRVEGGTSNIELSVDGVSSSGITLSGFLSNLLSNDQGIFLFGRDTTTGSQTGTVDQLLISSDLWTQAMIDEAYNSGVGTEYLNLTIPPTPESTAQKVIGETTGSIAGVTTWFPIIIVITAMVVLILLTIIIITSIRGSGLIPSESA